MTNCLKAAPHSEDMPPHSIRKNDFRGTELTNDSPLLSQSLRVTELSATLEKIGLGDNSSRIDCSLTLAAIRGASDCCCCFCCCGDLSECCALVCAFICCCESNNCPDGGDSLAEEPISEGSLVVFEVLMSSIGPVTFTRQKANKRRGEMRRIVHVK